jgi:hypothetical protein
MSFLWTTPVEDVLPAIEVGRVPRRWGGRCSRIAALLGTRLQPCRLASLPHVPGQRFEHQEGVVGEEEPAVGSR